MEQPDADDPDAELVDRIGQGDARAFRTLVDRKLARVHALALRRLGDRAGADDVTQDAFERVWRHAGRSTSCGRPKARFDTWLHRVVLNLCTDRLRRRRDVLVDELPDIADPAPGAQLGLERDETARRVRAAVDGLPPRQREAILLHTYAELSPAEVASTMLISAEALESLLARARRTLRDTLGATLVENRP